jgi:hypothetical protein
VRCHSFLLLRSGQSTSSFFRLFFGLSVSVKGVVAERREASRKSDHPKIFDRYVSSTYLLKHTNGRTENGRNLPEDICAHNRVFTRIA